VKNESFDDFLFLENALQDTILITIKIITIKIIKTNQGALENGAKSAHSKNISIFNRH